MKWVILTLVFYLMQTATIHGFECPAITNSIQFQSFLEKKETSADEKLLVRNLGTAYRTNFMWAKGTAADQKYEVPYYLNIPNNERLLEAVYFAMVVVERGTNVVFLKREPKHKDYIAISQAAPGQGCHTSIGAVPAGNSIVLMQLAPECANPRDTTRELLRAFGLQNEHQRSDRGILNTYWKTEAGFKVDPYLVPTTPYDPFSIMHASLINLGTIARLDPAHYTPDDQKKAEYVRGIPTPCDYKAVNTLFPGERVGDSCSDFRKNPMYLKPAKQGQNLWDGESVKDRVKESLEWFCNWNSGGTIRNQYILSQYRSERQYCMFEKNGMYPEFPVYATSKEYPPQRICDCLPAPPNGSGFTDNSMFQTCLECVHTSKTTQDVLPCIAAKSKNSQSVSTDLTKGYPSTYYREME